jgi:hypothetical protein
MSYKLLLVMLSLVKSQIFNFYFVALECNVKVKVKVKLSLCFN